MSRAQVNTATFAFFTLVTMPTRKVRLCLIAHIERPGAWIGVMRLYILIALQTMDRPGCTATSRYTPVPLEVRDRHGTTMQRTALHEKHLGRGHWVESSFHETMPPR